MPENTLPQCIDALEEAIQMLDDASRSPDVAVVAVAILGLRELTWKSNTEIGVPHQYIESKLIVDGVIRAADMEMRLGLRSRLDTVSRLLGALSSEATREIIQKCLEVCYLVRDHGQIVVDIGGRSRHV